MRLCMIHTARQGLLPSLLIWCGVVSQVVHSDVITYRQNVDKLAEQQQSKYLDLYTILPSEISMQLAEVSLALGAIEDQVGQNHVLARIAVMFIQVNILHVITMDNGITPPCCLECLWKVLSREREIQKTRDIKEDFSSKIHDVSEKLKSVSSKFKEKSPDVDHAKEEVKVGPWKPSNKHTELCVRCAC